MFEDSREKTISLNTRYFRKKRELDQLDLAKKLNYSKTWVSDLENGKKSIKLGVQKRLADVLGITRETLAGEDPDLLERFAMIDQKIHKCSEKIELIELVENLIRYVDEQGGPRDQIRARMQRGNVEYIHANYEVAVNYYRQVEAIAVKWEDSIASHKARVNIAYCHLYLRELDAAEEIIKKDLGEVEDAFAMLKDRYTLGRLYYTQERLNKAEQVLAPLLDLSGESIAEKHMKIDCDTLMGFICLYNERYEEARSFANSALELIRDMGIDYLEPYALQIQGEVALNTGDLPRGWVYLSEAYLKRCDKNSADAKELEFWIACCIDDRLQSFEKAKGILLDLVEQHPGIRFVYRLYEKMAQKAYELDMVDESYLYSRKAIQTARFAIG